MARGYQCLSQQVFSSGQYQFVPIRDIDKFSVMDWRNDQVDILRQEEPLTRDDQKIYFKRVVDKLFSEHQPSQLLFSQLIGDKLIGYGGLVHINWRMRNAEVSFLNSTERARTESLFRSDFTYFLKFIFAIAKEELDFSKLHTTVYDLEERKVYLDVLKDFGFILEEILEAHVKVRGRLRDAMIYSYTFDNL